MNTPQAWPRTLLLVLGFVVASYGLVPRNSLHAETPGARIVEVRKIWDKAPHNAFTDLIRHQGQWFCVFREGKGHVSPDGAMRIITSEDGKTWKSAALLTEDWADLRDAKITVTPDNQLMLCGAAAVHQPADYRHQSLAWFSKDGYDWSQPSRIGEKDFWLWRVTWHKQDAYGIGYATNQANKMARLYKSGDGRNFEVLVENLFDEGYPNETSLVFLPDDKCVCLLRRDGEPSSALLGTATPPYTDWQWRELGVRVGGPHMIRLPNGKLIAAGRQYEGGAKTRIWEVDLEAGRLQTLVTLPSGGDTSYPGLVWHEGQLWVSYYSSHEGKTSIYLAVVEINNS